MTFFEENFSAYTLSSEPEARSAISCLIPWMDTVTIFIMMGFEGAQSVEMRKTIGSGGLKYIKREEYVYYK